MNPICPKCGSDNTEMFIGKFDGLPSIRSLDRKQMYHCKHCFHVFCDGDTYREEAKEEKKIAKQTLRKKAKRSEQ
jgi:transposase-like protein